MSNDKNKPGSDLKLDIQELDILLEISNFIKCYLD